jgi:polar amino acid transport system substrate-binding protein
MIGALAISTPRGERPMIVPSGRRLLHAGVAFAIVASALGGCGSSGSPSASQSAGGAGGGPITATRVESVAGEVPASIRARGTMILASDASYAPNEFVGPDGRTIQGMDADMAVALGQVMGLSVQMQNVKFDNILPGIQGGRYDLGMSSLTDSREREQVVDFVTYFRAGTSFFVRAGGPTVRTLDDLCGRRVSVETGTTQETDANAQRAACTRAGRADVTVLSFSDQNATDLALQSSRVDVSMADSPVAAYQVAQSNGQFQLSGQPYGTAPYGIALPKGNGMSRPVLDAVRHLMSSGVYSSILARWKVTGGAITDPGINQAAS